MKLRITLFIATTLMLTACGGSKWAISSVSSNRIAIDSTTERYADKSYEAYLQPMKTKLDKEMNVVIGQTDVTMRAHGPESLLSNFSADVYRKIASEYLKEQVDIAIVNLGGLRTTIPAGDITLRKVFELMPFENELVILWLKGDKLNDLLQYFASMGGEGVSGIRMRIDQGKAVDITINGQPLDINRSYSIATNDFLAGGNDKMVQLATAEKRVNTSIKVRNMLLDYIKNETANGRKIQSQLDGRITLSSKGE
jgi:2',3'-cyclic-nucleotide 2'-phosphodiesterase (5'-nucleotidase family)